MSLLYYCDLLGTFVFAISGVLFSSNNRFDFFGASVIAFVTAMGGGTLRDILLDCPIGWMQNTTYLYVVLAAIFISASLKQHIIKFSRPLFLFDTIGLAAFTILGVQKAIMYNASPVIAIIMGTLTAVFGGVIRDVLCNEQPLIFRKEIYATPCILGGGIFLALQHLKVDINISVGITAAFIIALRLIAVKREWSLPVIP